MTDTKNPQGGQQNQTFDLEEVVVNTQTAQNKNTSSKPEVKSDAEIVSAMQGASPKQTDTNTKETKPKKSSKTTENLDSVVNPTPKKEEKKTETIDDILIEEEPKKKPNKKGGLLVAGILLAL